MKKKTSGNKKCFYNFFLIEERVFFHEFFMWILRLGAPCSVRCNIVVILHEKKNFKVWSMNNSLLVWNRQKTWRLIDQLEKQIGLVTFVLWGPKKIVTYHTHINSIHYKTFYRIPICRKFKSDFNQKKINIYK